mmetsp:Transcript_29271/g.25884  ORF Transcript_29271/g.25884 Transcript_29271/m.25884 type:complete len:176 (-) Transcript_29271:105-632(-)
MLRSLKTDDIPGAHKRERNIQQPHNSMTIDDIDGARPSVFRHRWFDKKKININAKYNHIFDQFGNRKLEITPRIDSTGDPLASSKERRKSKQPSIITDSVYKPKQLGGVRLSRRYYNGLYKNRSNVGEILREARNEVNQTLNQNHSMNLTVDPSLASPSCDSPSHLNTSESRINS